MSTDKKYNRAPGEIAHQKVINIGKDECRTYLQHYYAIGGSDCAFGTFKGRVAKIVENKEYLFKKLYVEFDDGPDIVEGKEDHIWIYDAKPFEEMGVKVGDCVAFTALAYAYRRQDGTEDYSLKSPSEIEIIEDYELPTNEALEERMLSNLACEMCLYASQCYGEPCIAPDGYREGMREFLKKCNPLHLVTE